MTDRNPEHKASIQQSMVDDAIQKLKRIALENGVDEVQLAQRVAEEVKVRQESPDVLEKITIIDDSPEKNADVQERGISSNPVDLFISSIEQHKQSEVVNTSVLAYGKQLGQGGATDFIEFGTQHRNGYKTFENLFGAQFQDVSHGSTFSSKSNIEFFDKIKEKEGYPPAVMVIQNGSQIILCSARHLNEGAYSRSKGEEARTNRPYFDYRAYTIPKDEIDRFTKEGVAWETSFARLPQIHKLPTYSKVDSQQAVDFANLNNSESRLSVKSSVFKNSEEFSHLFASSLLALEAGQPIIVEQNWTLDEKTIFVQMLQQSMASTGHQGFVSWSSEPIATFSRGLDIIFRKFGELAIYPTDKDWAKYKTISETTNSTSLDEKEYINAVSKILSSSSSWKEIQDRLSKFRQTSKNVTTKISEDYLHQRDEKVSQLVADRSRRLNYVKSQFKFGGENVSQEFADWIYPSNSSEPVTTIRLPEEYFTDYKKDEFPGTYLMQDTSYREARFLLTFLSKNANGIDNFNSYNKIQKSVLEVLAKNFVKATNSGIEVDAVGLYRTLDLSKGFEIALGGSSHGDSDIDQIFTKVFGQPNVSAAFQQAIENKQKGSGYSENNVLYKKKMFGGFELTPQGKQLLDKHFSERVDAGNVDYLTQWTNFLGDYIQLKRSSQR